MRSDLTAPLLGKLVGSVQVSRSSHTQAALLVSVHRERKTAEEASTARPLGRWNHGSPQPSKLSLLAPEFQSIGCFFSSRTANHLGLAFVLPELSLLLLRECLSWYIHTFHPLTAFCCLTPRTEDRTGRCQHRARIPSHNMKMHESPQSQKLSHQCRREARVAAKPAMNCCESI